MANLSNIEIPKGYEYSDFRVPKVGDLLLADLCSPAVCKDSLTIPAIILKQSLVPAKLDRVYVESIQEWRECVDADKDISSEFHYAVLHQSTGFDLILEIDRDTLSDHQTLIYQGQINDQLEIDKLDTKEGA